MSGAGARRSARVRPYRGTDTAALTQLFFATVRQVPVKEYSPAELAAWAHAVPQVAVWRRRMAGRHSLVAASGDEILGFAELTAAGELGMLYCRHDQVRRGIGTMLCERLERIVRDLGLTRVTTEASITARPFFARRGYVVQRRRIVRRRGVRLANFTMVKSLDTSTPL